MRFSTPIALVIFNRPALAERVFEAVARVKPEKLFIAADGPRFPEEAERCQQARAIINRIDWGCKLYTNFSDVNIGCAQHLVRAFDWVFSEVEEAIILEDDLLPSASFFNFCQTLLGRYRNDARIMHITGNNFQGGISRTDYSYYFSKYPHVWGWATWRRAWANYDFYLKKWPEFKKSNLMKMVCDDLAEEEYWTDIFDRMHEDPVKMNAYDYQWMFACWAQNGLAIAPNINLVTNVGFGEAATHTTDPNDRNGNIPFAEIGEIEHPAFVVRNKEADAYTFDHVFGGRYRREHQLRRKLFAKLPQNVQRAYKKMRART